MSEHLERLRKQIKTHRIAVAAATTDELRQRLSEIIGQLEREAETEERWLAQISTVRD